MTPKYWIAVPMLSLMLIGCGDNESTTTPVDPIDTAPPATPSGLDLAARTSIDPHITIAWDANAEPDFARYELQRSLDEGATWTIVSYTLTDNEYVDTYYSKAEYRVSAFDESDNQSAFSSPVSYLAANDTPKLPQDAEQPVW